MKEKNYSRRYLKEFNFFRALVQFWAVFCICVPFWFLFYKIEIKGRENLPKKGKFILTANHISYFDPFLVFMIFCRPAAFMAKKELFETPGMRFWMDWLGAFAVNREKLEVSTIKTAKDVLKSRYWNLGIFPQGGIRLNKKIEGINKGFAYLAKMVGYDIIPIGLSGFEEYNWKPFQGKIRINIGKPIASSGEIDDIIDEWSKTVAELAGYEYVKEESLEAALQA